jgi:glycosyltransferase involved in cell wall biosynthesis
MKNVLMIAYYYPPLGGVGSLRPLQFSRYLPEFGWVPSIVTVSNDTSYQQDDSLTRAIPSGQRIARAYRYPIYATIRKFMKGPLRKYTMAYSFLDPYFDWVPSAIKSGLNLSKQIDFDVILATAPPYSTIRVALELGKKLGIPVIADLRDPLSDNFNIKWPSRAHKYFYKIYEMRLLTSVNQLITVNEIEGSKLQSKHNGLFPTLEIIPNGYDPLDFAADGPIPTSDKFVFGHIGSIYEGMSVRPFFHSLSLAIKNRPEMSEVLEIRFMGNYNSTALLADANEYGVANYLFLFGFRPHSEAVRLMQQCHVLLNLAGMVLPSYITGKIYEYGASGRPVLNFAHSGNLADFIEQNEFGFSVDWPDPTEACNKIVELYDMWKNKVPIQGAPKASTEQFSRRALTKRLVEVLNKTCAANGVQKHSQVSS